MPNLKTRWYGPFDLFHKRSKDPKRSELYLEGFVPKRNLKATLVGTGSRLKWSKRDKGISIKISEK